MKKVFALLLCSLLLSGCAEKTLESGKPTENPEISTSEAVNYEVETSSTTDTAQREAQEIIQMTVYVPNDNADGFKITTAEGETLTFLEAMIEAGVLTEDIQINSIMREETHFTIDFNQAFKDLVCTMGTSGERMIVGSVVNTLIANYEVDTVSITVDGETWESGHVVYDFPLGFYE